MRKSIAVIGLQDGDEGKGKIVDYLVSRTARHVALDSSIIPCERKPILVRRFNGGANAGHTINVEGTNYKLHQIPAGILTPETYNLDGKEMFIHPRKLMAEIEGLRKLDIPVTPDNFGVAANAHVTLDYHIRDDQAGFQLEKHTSTGSGIAQTAVDKYGRVGIRFIEFLDPSLMKDILRSKRFPSGMPSAYGMTIDQLVESYDAERQVLAPFVVMEHAVTAFHGTSLLLDEGANGVGLDVDDGFYDGVTSSRPARAPREAETVLGVFKLYKSSVGTGNRPFVTRIPYPLLETAVRNATGERGTTTGKDRELGWFDIPAARYATEVAGVDCIVGTRGDSMEVFANLGVKPKICVAYDIDGKKYDAWDVSFFRRDTLYNAVPILEEFSPWEKFVEEDRVTLTRPAANYVRRIEDLLGKRFSILGTGPGREDVIEYGLM
ncbi:adenylosuccinate synthetase [Candidatus Woesearchaeota archaeon]|nr:adenylosuccinate synthetase [Candidatus Woesearchaeota archaeon]